jgi:hypothetical protein
MAMKNNGLLFGEIIFYFINNSSTGGESQKVNMYSDSVITYFPPKIINKNVIPYISLNGNPTP